MTLFCSPSSVDQAFGPHRSETTSICFRSLKYARFCFNSSANNVLKIAAHCQSLEVIFQMKTSLMTVEVNQEVTHKRAGIGRSVFLANSKWCVRAFEPLYIPFGE